MSAAGKTFRKNGNAVSYREYLRQERGVVHAPYMPEMAFYEAVKSGDTDRVQELCKEKFHEKKGLGVLSDNELQSMKYHFVITAAMTARVCIAGGMQMSEAYDMSDYYIQKADRARSIEKISELHDEMCMAYTERMNKLHTKEVCSKPIVRCIDYIYEHLDTRITIEDLCGTTGLSAAYISRIFKRETGQSVSKYILLKKLETAKSMLAYSDDTIAQISDALGFPNQSYFTRVFKAEEGTTPKNYAMENRGIISNNDETRDNEKWCM